MPRLPRHLKEPFRNWIPPQHRLTSSTLNKYLFPLVDADTVVTPLSRQQLSVQGAGQCWSEPQEGRALSWDKTGTGGHQKSLHPFFEAPSLMSPLIHPREGLHISDDGVIWDLTVLGTWSLGSETSNNFCEGYRLFLALPVPVSSPSHGPRQGNEPRLPLPAACGSTSLFGMLGSQGMASPLWPQYVLLV